MITRGEEILLPPSANWYFGHVSACSRDAQYYAYAAGNSIIVVDPINRKFINKLDGHTKRVSALCFTDSGMLLSGAQDKGLRIWNMSNAQFVKCYHKRAAEITALVVLNSFSECAIVGDKGGNLAMWTVEFETKPKALRSKMTAPIMSLAASPFPAASHVAVGCEDGMVAIVDVEMDALVNVVQEKSNYHIQTLSWVIPPHQSTHLKRRKQNPTFSDSIKIKADEPNHDTTAGPSQLAFGCSNHSEMETGPVPDANGVGGSTDASRVSLGLVLAGDRVSCELQVNSAEKSENGLGAADHAEGENLNAASEEEAQLMKEAIIVAGCQDGQIRIWKTRVSGDPPMIDCVDLIQSIQVKKAPPTVSEEQQKRLWVSARVAPFPCGMPDSWNHFWLVASGYLGDMTAWVVPMEKGPILGRRVQLPTSHTRNVFSIDFIRKGLDHGFVMVTNAMDRHLSVCDIDRPGVTNHLCDSDLKAMKLSWWYTGVGSDISSLEIKPGADCVAVGCGDKSIRIVPATHQGQTRIGLMRWRGVSDRVTIATWHPYASDLLAFGCEDGSVGLMRVASEESFIFSIRHKAAVKNAQWKSCVRDGGDLGADLFTLGQEGCLLKWPEVPDDCLCVRADDSKKTNKQPKSLSKHPIDISRKMQGLPGGQRLMWCDFRWDISGTFLALGATDGQVAVYMELGQGSLTLQCSTRHYLSPIKSLNWKLPKEASPLLAALHDDGRVGVHEIGIGVGSDGAQRMVLNSVCKIISDRAHVINWGLSENTTLFGITKQGKGVSMLRAWDVKAMDGERFSRTVQGSVENFVFLDNDTFVVARDHSCLTKVHIPSMPIPGARGPRGGARVRARNERDALLRQQAAAAAAEGVGVEPETGDGASTAGQDKVDSIDGQGAALDVGQELNNGGDGWVDDVRDDVMDDIPGDFMPVGRASQGASDVEGPVDGRDLTMNGVGQIAEGQQEESAPDVGPTTGNGNEAMCTPDMRVIRGGSMAVHISGISPPGPADVLEEGVAGAASSEPGSTSGGQEAATLTQMPAASPTAKNRGSAASMGTEPSPPPPLPPPPLPPVQDLGNSSTNANRNGGLPERGVTVQQRTAAVAEPIGAVAKIPEASSTGEAHTKAKELVAKPGGNKPSNVSKGRIAGRKRKVSMLGSAPLMDDLVEAKDEKDQEALCLELAQNLFTQQKQPLSGLASLGIFPSHMEASANLKASTQMMTDPTDSKTAEKKAAIYFWQGAVQEALDALKEGNCLDGDFLSMAVAGGVDVWASAVQSRANYLESIGEVHLAALHYLSVGATRAAITVYRRAGLAEDALRLGSVRLMKGDPLLDELQAEKAELDARSSKFFTAAAGFLAVGKGAEAIQILIDQGSPQAWLTAAKIVKKFRAVNAEGDIPGCPLEKAERALIRLGTQGETGIIEEILDAWKDRGLLCAGVLSLVVASRQASEFQVQGIGPENGEEPAVGDVLRAVGVVVPLWAKTVETVLGNATNAETVSQAGEDVMAQFKAIGKLDLVEKEVRCQRAKQLCECYLHHSSGQTNAALQTLTNWSTLGQQDPLPTDSDVEMRDGLEPDETLMLPGSGAQLNRKHTNANGGLVENGHGSSGKQRHIYTKEVLLQLETNREEDRLGFDDSVIPELFRLSHYSDAMDTS